MNYKRLEINDPGMVGVSDPHVLLRLLLESWLYEASQPGSWLLRFTHARCLFDINQPGADCRIISWKVLRADAGGIEDEVELANSWLYGGQIRGMLNHLQVLYVIGHGSIGQLTVHFKPARIGLDVMSSSNEPVFAEYLIDLDAEQRVQYELSLIVHNFRS